MSKKTFRIRKRHIFLGLFAAGMLFVSGGLIWASTLTIPDITTFSTRKVAESTKIYDRTGKVTLYDVHGEVRRTVIDGDQISKYMRQAIVAIEDQDFYNHIGIDFSAILRAVWVDLKHMNFKQGGSTITQQVIKNSLLTNEKKISRKVKEWILAIKLENVYDKEEILTLYLNEIPFGGMIYGIEEAAQGFFGKPASELTLAESAYLAAVPQAPTYYSPYGNHRDELEARKNLVLRRMLDNKYISQEVYEDALEEEVRFSGADERGLKAGHFVFYVLDYLEEKYGEEMVREGGLRVITTLDYDLQKDIEDRVYDYILENQNQFSMENASVIVTDPKTGQILVMVGSRKYSDTDIDGAVNVALRPRQPGSTFKPFAYANAFNRGYTPDTIIFDLRTQFSTSCEPYETTRREAPCFSPENYDFAYSGPVTMRSALAASKNVPAVKTFYLAGMRDTINLARSLGMTTLDPVKDANLSLVLGSGEVKLLDITNAYGAFANNGIYHEPARILRVEDREGKVLEEFTEKGKRLMPEKTALQITDILADRSLRVGTFGAGTALDIPNPNIAVKTGTTNNYIDVWTIGYNTEMTLGIWGGNNNGDPIERKVSAYVIAPLWRELLDIVVEKYPGKNFPSPNYDYSGITKPILTGDYTGGTRQFDMLGNPSITGGSIHSILHWVVPENPLGPIPTNPYSNSQYEYWEYPVALWSGGITLPNNEPGGEFDIPSTPSGDFTVEGLYPDYEQGERIRLDIYSDTIDITRAEARIGNTSTEDRNRNPRMSLSTRNLEEGDHILTVIVFGRDGQRYTKTFSIEIYY